MRDLRDRLRALVRRPGVTVLPYPDPLIVAVVILAACIIPTRRATRVDPIVAVRTE